MKDKRDTTFSQTTAPKTAGVGKWLARMRRKLIKGTGRPDPVILEQAYWASIFDHSIEAECSPKHFRKFATEMRRSGNLTEAENICSRGVDLHPTDLPLAIEHAEIAKALKNHKVRESRCEHIVRLAGASAPISAFLNLADCYLQNGRIDKAESTIRNALDIHTADFTLQTRLAGILSSAGANARAIPLLESLIRLHPDADLANTYLQFGNLFANEGLLDRAVKTLSEGLHKYQNSEELKQRIAEITYLQEGAPLLRSAPSVAHAEIHHLFEDFFTPHGRGTLCFPLVNNSLRQHVPAMLDFAVTIPAPDIPRRMPEVDVFAVWGDPIQKNLIIQKLAARENKPLLYIDSGFLSSPVIEGRDNPAHSIVICPGGAYFDATQATYLEDKLNSENHHLTEDQRIRAEEVIASILSHRISKFNHAPHIDLRHEFPQDGTRRILLIDQKKGGGGSLHWSLGGPGTFERMLDSALTKYNYEILVKIHPEVISGHAESQLRPLLPNPLPKNIKVIDYDVNPFDLFDVVDEVYVATSVLGFEAVMAGRQVHCFASPFYSGWGFTIDRTVVPRRNRTRNHIEIFHLYYIIHSRYYTPENSVTEIENLVTHLSKTGKGHSSDPLPEMESEYLNSSPQLDGQLRILMVIPSGRFGATGRYLQNLSVALIQQGCEVMILAEGPCPKKESGVHWITLEFDKQRLTPAIRHQITQFAPHFIYENGVRSRAQRAALEAMFLTGARLAMQSEDDDIQIHLHKQGEAAAAQLTALDHPKVTTAQIAEYLKCHDWDYSLNILLNPNLNRWIEPLLRILCYRLASFHTAIWHPFAERLAREYNVPTLVVPPVASAADFERIPFSPGERETVLQRYGIDPERVVIFIGGALYNYSHEYAIFLDALSLAAEMAGHRFSLVVTSSRSSLPLRRMADERLSKAVSFTNLGMAVDEIYTEMLKACDVVCSPGLPDTFNRYRLPSRLVKAMAMGKPILTCRCGFGESLESGFNAFLTDGDDASDWANVIAACLDSDQRNVVGRNGRIFAENHFNSDLVAGELKKKFEAMMEGPPRRLGDAILHGPADPPLSGRSRTRSMVKAFSSNRYRSSMQDALNLLQLLTPKLGTVLHIGAGECKELENYCRLGADKIILVEPIPELAASLKTFEDLHGRISVRQMTVSGEHGVRQAYICKSIRPDSGSHEELYLSEPDALLGLRPSLQILRTQDVETFTINEICQDLPLGGLDNLLVLELNGLEVEALKKASQSVIRNFEWIAVRASELPLFRHGATLSEVKAILQELGYEYIPSPENFSGPQVTALFVIVSSS